MAPRIHNSVGSNGKNDAHEVSLVQLMLGLIKSPSTTAYFTSPYTQRYTDQTTAAIKAFQVDQKLNDKQGLIEPNKATWNALLAAFSKLGDPWTKVRTWRRVSFAYLAQGPEALGKAENSGNAGLQDSFQRKIMTLIRNNYAESEIAWTLPKDSGGRRTFAGQEGKVSDAGYGESIHAYGFAADLTVFDFSWIDVKLRIDPVKSNMEGENGQWVKQLFAARDAVGKDAQLGLEPTEKKGDLFHVQAYNDHTLDSVGSLQALMTKVGPRHMKWEPKYKTPTDYYCDLGLGGDKYYVGTATTIFKLDPNDHISSADLTAALKAKLKLDPTFSVSDFLGRTDKKLGADFKEADINRTDIQAVQRLLKAEFDAAAANWQKWQPVVYPNEDRRPDNPKSAKKAR